MIFIKNKDKEINCDEWLMIVICNCLLNVNWVNVEFFVKGECKWRGVESVILWMIYVWWVSGECILKVL